MIGGGVATRRGDFLWTITVERCLEARDDPEILVGEKAATVGGSAVVVAKEAAGAPSSCG